MPITRKAERDARDYDLTQLHANGHGKTLHRDYSAHFFRWSFARRFITASDDVLEVGCGEDRPLSKILTGGAAAHVNQYVGVDLNKLKESASQRLTFLGEFNFVERWRELLKPPCHDGPYDVLVHFEVFEHMRVDHGLAFMKAAFKCVKPGGVMLMSTPCYDGKRQAANHIHEYTVPLLQSVIEGCGFDVERRFGTFMDVKHIGKQLPHAEHCTPKALKDACQLVRDELADYFDNDAISNIFGPLHPDHARNNLWICRRPK